jgi:hypothetical protein
MQIFEKRVFNSFGRLESRGNLAPVIIYLSMPVFVIFFLSTGPDLRKYQSSLSTAIGHVFSQSVE